MDYHLFKQENSDLDYYSIHAQSKLRYLTFLNCIFNFQKLKADLLDQQNSDLDNYSIRPQR